MIGEDIDVSHKDGVAQESPVHTNIQVSEPRPPFGLIQLDPADCFVRSEFRIKLIET